MKPKSKTVDGNVNLNVDEKKQMEEIASKIAKTLSQGIDSQIDEKLEKLLEKLEPVVNKNTGKQPEKVGEEILPKEIILARGITALKRNDSATLGKLNEINASKWKVLAEKTGYGNISVDADGAYVLADPEFEAEVEKLSENYGVAFQEASVRQLVSSTIKTNKRGSNVVMYEVGAGATITASKMTFEQVQVTLRKFAALSIAENELSDDAAIDYWDEVADGIALERARVADELVFTDDHATYPGIMKHEDVQIVSIGSSFDDISWDNLLDAESKVPTAARSNMKHYMHRTIWNLFLKVKDDQGRYQAIPYASMQTPWGTPVVLVDAMPSNTDVPDADEGYVVTGDLKRARLYVKKGIVFEESKESTLTDADGGTVNLYQQDMSAIRGISRMVCMIKFPEAFVVTGLGDVS